ncbi:MAG: hypothetical protein LC722_04820 [Actinobacteria bacterium]|nr:hypothetical protein [Actinomycetota bacterium]
MLDGRDLIDVIRRQLPAAPPGVALLTIEAIRLDLERLELQILHQARAAGHSWGQIAVARGIHRNTVQSRYRVLSRRWSEKLENLRTEHGIFTAGDRIGPSVLNRDDGPTT